MESSGIRKSKILKVAKEREEKRVGRRTDVPPTHGKRWPAAIRHVHCVWLALAIKTSVKQARRAR